MLRSMDGFDADKRPLLPATSELGPLAASERLLYTLSGHKRCCELFRTGQQGEGFV